jgi:hypothetical protein
VHALPELVQAFLQAVVPVGPFSVLLRRIGPVVARELERVETEPDVVVLLFFAALEFELFTRERNDGVRVLPSRMCGPVPLLVSDCDGPTPSGLFTTPPCESDKVLLVRVDVFASSGIVVRAALVFKYNWSSKKCNKKNSGTVQVGGKPGGYPRRACPASRTSDQRAPALPL